MSDEEKFQLYARLAMEDFGFIPLLSSAEMLNDGLY
jgi:hypothetical protein